MFGLGLGEVLLLGGVVTLLFGANKLPQLGSALGMAITNFKRGLQTGPHHETIDIDQTQKEEQKKNDE